MKIPCETIVRFCRIIDGVSDDLDPIFRTIRLDHGKLIASDRKLMVVETIEPFEGVFYITIDDALRRQCEVESGYSGWLEVVPNDILKYTVAKSSLGFTTQNIGVFPVTLTEFDKWVEVVERCKKPVDQSSGAMVWSTEDILRLAEASPSRLLVFETNFDVSGDRPCIVRDGNSADWCGFFMPRVKDGRYYAPAELPGWLK